MLYLIGLFWCFMGVSIIADVFMTAIEKVTSKKLRLYDRKRQKFYTFEARGFALWSVCAPRPLRPPLEKRRAEPSALDPVSLACPHGPWWPVLLAGLPATTQ